MFTRFLLTIGLIALWAIPTNVPAQSLECTDWQSRHPEWLWCDDFEADSLLERNYFDVNRAGGRMRVSPDAAFGGIASLKGTYIAGDQNAGSIKFSFGDTPVAPMRYADRTFEDVYWRFYMRTSQNWVGNAYKVTRATIFSASNWSQAAIGHLWEDDRDAFGMGIDPVSGVSGNDVLTTKYNDFDHFIWLGKENGTTQVYSAAQRGVWNCVEIHMKLNTPGTSDGVLEYWVNGSLEAQKRDLNFRGSYTAYGINAIMLENYSNNPPPQSQDRYFDNFVVSQRRIGCAEPAGRPSPPTDVRIR